MLLLIQHTSAFFSSILLRSLGAVFVFLKLEHVIRELGYKPILLKFILIVYNCLLELLKFIKEECSLNTAFGYCQVTKIYKMAKQRM